MKKSAQSILDSFRKIVRLLRKANSDSERKFGVTAAQLFVLQQLKKSQPLSLNELAEKTYSHQSTVSVVVSDLVKLGYIERTTSEQDRRKVKLRLTSQAQKILKRSVPTIQEQFVSNLLKMSPAKLRQLDTLLREFLISAKFEDETPHFFFENE